MAAIVSSPPPEMVVKKRFLGFLIWQSIPSTAIFLFFKTFLSSLSPKPSLLTATITFFTFHLVQLLFSASLSVVSSPWPHRPAHPLHLTMALLKFLLVSGGPGSPEFRRRARVSLGFFLFVSTAAASGLVAAMSVCLVGPLGDSNDGLVGRVGFRGFVMGLLYGLHFVYNRRWILEFPIIQRPPFFSFKMGLPPATTRALKLSGAAYLLSTALIILLPDQFASHVTLGKFIAEQIVFYLGSFAVFLSWELSYYLHRINLDKSVLLGINFDEGWLADLAGVVGCNVGSWLVKYLGLPLRGIPIHYLFWEPVISKVAKRLDGWKKAFFSKGGCLTFIQSVLSSLPIYYLSVFWIPVGVAKEIDKLMRDFL